MLEKMEMRKDAKESFAKIGEYGKMQDRLWSQMVQLDSPELKKSMKELRNRHCNTAFHEIAEHDGFESTFEKIILSFSCTPLNHSLTLQQFQILQFLHDCFRHFTLVPARGKIGNFFLINLGLVFLGSYLSVTSYDLGSGATRGAGKKGLGSIGSAIDGGLESKG